MKPASCFRDSAGFSNRQKRLQQNRRYAVEIHNGTILERVSCLPTRQADECSTLLSTANPIPPVPPITAILCSISMKKTSLGYFLMKERTFWTKLLSQMPYLSLLLLTLQRN